MSNKSIKIYRDSGPVDIALIEIIENELGVAFPRSYKTFISNHNAAYPKNNHFEYWDDYLKEEAEQSMYFFGFGKEQGLIESSESITRFQDFEIYGYDNVVAFGGTPEGDYVCFDYRHDPMTSEPKIAVMAHDMVYKDTRKMVINHVADSFDDFCQLLYDDPYADE